jgi:hypothetical protein
VRTTGNNRGRVSRRAAVIWGTGLAGAVAFAAGPVMASTPPPEIGPTPSDHAQVVAQGVVVVADGPHQWTATAHVVGAEETAIDPSSPTFLLAGAGSPVLLRSADGTQALLDEGEATYRPAGSTAVATAPGAVVGTLSALALEPAAAESDDSVTPGAGARDVELIRDVLAPGEALPLASDLPVFVLVTAGSVNGDDATAITAGGTGVVAGGSSLTNAGDSSAVLVAAVVGPAIDGFTPLAPAPAPETTTEPAPPTDAPETTTTSAPAPTTTTTTTTTVPTGDTDGDGFDDAYEEALGTDPNNPDTDGDNVSDSDEVGLYGSDPLDPDTDFDGLQDGDEVNVWLTDPTGADTDGDGVDDYAEVIDHGLDPNSPDTDSDGLTDGEELELGTDPDVADTDGDGFDDGTEVAAGTSPTVAYEHP